MTDDLWKKSFVIASVLLVISLILGISSWYQLYNLRVQLNAIEPEMNKLKAEQERILGSYAGIREQINLRSGIKHDSQSFITPDDPEISAIVQEVTDGYSDRYLWRDYGRLYQWTMRNIMYSIDSPTPVLPESINGGLEWGVDFWRMPVETLRDRTGDCEDTALFLTSLLLNYNDRRYPVWIVGLKTPPPTSKAHVAVVIPCENNRLAIFDIAGHYYTPFLSISGFGSQPALLALRHWLDHLEEDMPGAQIYMVFSESFYHEFSDNQEFLEWAYQLLTRH